MNPAVITNLVTMIERLRADLGEHDADEILRADMIEGETDADAVLRKLVRSLNVAKADAVGAKEAMAAVTARYKAREESADRRKNALTAMVLAVMVAIGEKSKRLPEGSISVTPGRASLDLEEGFRIPQGYERVKIDPDKASIKAALEAGETIPGAALKWGEPIVRVT